MNSVSFNWQLKNSLVISTSECWHSHWLWHRSTAEPIPISVVIIRRGGACCTGSRTASQFDLNNKVRRMTRQWTLNKANRNIYIFSKNNGNILQSNYGKTNATLWKELLHVQGITRYIFRHRALFGECDDLENSIFALALMCMIPSMSSTNLLYQKHLENIVHQAITILMIHCEPLSSLSPCQLEIQFISPSVVCSLHLRIQFHRHEMYESELTAAQC